MNRPSLLRLSLAATFLAASLATTASASAQISLQTAVDLALRNSPKVRGAQADLDKARAAHGEARAAYVPVIVSQGGYGQATGAPLGVPVIFSISTQSLVFSFSQRDYIRSAQASIEAAEHALHEQQIEVVEDTTNTYLALDSAIARKRVLAQESEFALRLVTVTSDRIATGVDAQVELPKAHRTATQIRLASLQLDDEIAANSQHLGTLTALPPTVLLTETASIPKFESPAPPPEQADRIADSEGINAVFASARAKQFAAFGDRRYLFRPNISLVTNYSRVDTGLSSYASYYPRYQGTPGSPNSQNSLGFGLQINVPLLDMAHRSRARGSAADAARALADAEVQRGVFREGRARLQHSALELQLRADLARDEQEIAQDQLQALEIQMQAGSADLQGPQVTPKDQLNAQLQERQRTYDMLTAELQLRQTQVNLLRQSDHLGVWVGGRTAGGSAVPVIAPTANAPGVPGSAPLGPAQTAPVIPAPATPTPATPRP